ncbi:phage tail family protein [Bacillus sp. JJ1127]|uniref:phage tail family protein n=1 Tax=Bacillus sp. JJ1127 TaxID=3122952 RepID=UPI002FFE5736
MMEKVTFTNAKGESVVISDALPFQIVTITGLGDVEAEIQSQKSSYKDGSKFVNALMAEREIDVELLIEAENYGTISKHRSKLTRVLNPKLGLGVLRYENESITVEIDATIESLPSFPDGNENRGHRWQKATVSFVCPDPYFRKGRKRDEIALWLGAFEFPLEIPMDGLEFGYRSPSLIVNVVNEGHTETGMEIHFRALSTVINPSLVNVNTQEYLRINKTMIPGETIIVNTTRGNKSVMSSVEGKIMRRLELGSTFLQLEIGDNLFRYDAEKNLEQLEVTIYHTSKILGV